MGLCDCVLILYVVLSFLFRGVEYEKYVVLIPTNTKLKGYPHQTKNEDEIRFVSYLPWLCATAFADEFDSQVEEADARFLYFNTSSTATSLTLLGALILLGVIFYLVYAGGILGGSAYNRNDYGYQGYGDQYV